LANQDRIQRFDKIRTLLDYPISQKPSAHAILNAMLMEEQTLVLQLTNSQVPWNLVSSTITTVSGTHTYEISQPVSAYQSSGKAHFVVRSTNNTDLPYLPVPFDDFSEQNYGNMPPSGQVNSALSVPELISFYRTGQQNQTIQAVIQPVPQEVLTYTVWFFTGSVDRQRSLMEGTGPIIELADYLDWKAALQLLAVSEWSDDEVKNDNKRKGLAMTFASKIAELKPIADKYISRMNAPKGFEMDTWNA